MTTDTTADIEWETATRKVKEKYPDIDIDTKLKLMNMYFEGKQDGMNYTKSLLNNDEYMRSEPVSDAPDWGKNA